MGLYSKIKRKFSGKPKEKPSGELKGGNRGSSLFATAAVDLSSPPTTVALGSASEPTNVSSITTIIAQPPPEQVALSITQPASGSPAPAPSVPIQPTASDTSAAPLSSHGFDPWARAYEIFQDRQPQLVADYKKHLASLQDDAAASTDLSTPRSVESVVKQLLEDREKKQWRVSLQGKDIKTREQAERLVKFLIWSDQIVKNAVSVQPYAALAWSGVSILLPLLNSGTAQNEAMLKGFNSINDIQVYWILSEKTYLQSPHRQNYQDLVEPLAKLYSYVIEYQARVICHLSSAQLSRAWQNVTDQNSWVSLVGMVNDLSKGCSDCIPPLREEELRKNRDSQLQEMQGSRIILDEILRILKEGGEQTQRNYEKQEERDLLRDLASDYEGYKNFNEIRVPGTCEWFFDDDRFRRWRDSSISSLLWVSAGPGCGKSVLSRALIDEGRLSTNVTTSTVCHFFFKDGEEGRMESTNALCAILHRLFTQDPTGSLIRYALNSYQNHGRKLTLNFSELWQILEKCAGSSDTREIVCILDALDECNAAGRLQLIKQLKEFYFKQDQSSRRLKLKFLITSRPYDDLEASFRNFSNTTAYLRFDGDNKSKEINQEINLVIDARMDDIAGDFADEDRRKISERLKSMDHRTYLWLHLTIDIIKQSPSKYGRLYDVENLLSELPAEISDAYENILGRSKDEKHTEILLQIILAAAQPLTLDEANIALTLALQKEQFMSHAALQSSLWPSKNFQSTVKNLCGLFINVYDSKLSFIHQTAREFLLHPKRQGKWKGRLNMPESHSTISRPCLYYLLLPDIVTLVQDDDTNNPQYPFLHYAALNWPLHYNSQNFHDTGIGSEKEISALALSLCESGSKRYNAWSSIYASTGKLYHLPPNASSLTIASYFGFKAVVQLLLATGKVEPDSKDGYNQTPLSHAAKKGHEAIVQLLLATGKVEPDLKDYDERTPLSYAAEGGYEAIVQLLQKHIN
ncbi:Ankyrin repeat-containing domain protein [Rutstroemia sp. NJR-2017a WRK4]|nr:Ankyrin repeat-containing domain protein [Rutstroemia sp. NJR-2017a WRK4]